MVPISAARAEDAQWVLPLKNGVTIEATASPVSPLLAEFYAGYDRAFVLPDEKEDLDGFRACLALNPVSRHRFGRTHSELVLVARDAASGNRLGGANFLAATMATRPGHPAVSVALNYLYVEPGARGRGLSRILLDAVARLANRAVGHADERAWPAIFIEQNDPLLMSAEAYALDSSLSGIDQVDRLRIWNRLGAHLVDIGYVQPALAAGRLADRTLAYAAVQFPGEIIASGFLHDHLESFFGISVLKGGDPHADAIAQSQLAALSAMESRGEGVALLDMSRAVQMLGDKACWRVGTPLRRFIRDVAHS